LKIFTSSLTKQAQPEGDHEFKKNYLIVLTFNRFSTEKESSHLSIFNPKIVTQLLVESGN
jgi:hypothetical protein